MEDALVARILMALSSGSRGSLIGGNTDSASWHLSAGEPGATDRLGALCKISLTLEAIEIEMNYAILRSPVSRRHLRPHALQSWRESQLSELHSCTFPLGTIKQLENFDYSVALMSVRA